MYFLPIGIPSWLYAIGYVSASFYGMHRQLDNVGHDAHLGGALVGLFTMAALHPQAIRQNPWLFAAISAATVLLIFYMARNPLMLPLKRLDYTKAPARSGGWRRLIPFRFPVRRRTNPALASAPIATERKVDAILQKISESGMESLTDEERRLLGEVSDQYRRRAERKNANLGFPF